MNKLICSKRVPTDFKTGFIVKLDFRTTAQTYI